MAKENLLQFAMGQENILTGRPTLFSASLEFAISVAFQKVNQMMRGLTGTSIISLI